MISTAISQDYCWHIVKFNMGLFLNNTSTSAIKMINIFNPRTDLNSGDFRSFNSSSENSFKLFVFKSEKINFFFKDSTQVWKKHYKTANRAHRWVWHNLDLALWGCHFQQDNPYRGQSINDEDYLVGSLTSEWVTRQDTDITGKNQTQQSPFTKPYRLLTIMGGLSYYIIIFLSDCHILCKYKLCQSST